MDNFHPWIMDENYVPMKETALDTISYFSTKCVLINLVFERKSGIHLLQNLYWNVVVGKPVAVDGYFR